jgi:hypothetical protein
MRTRLIVLVSIGLVIVLGGGVAIKRYAERVARTRLDSALANFSSHADIRYDDVRVDLLRLTAHVYNVTVRPVGTETRMRVADVAVRDLETRDGVPTAVDVRLTGLTAAAAELRALDPTEIAEVLGEQAVEGDVELRYRYAPDLGDLEIDTLAVGLKALGRVEGSLHVARLRSWGDDWLERLEALGEAALHRVTLQYEDWGLLPQLVVATALEKGSSLEDATRLLAQRVEGVLADELGEGDTQARTALQNFLRRPGTIRLSLHPGTPLPLGHLLFGTSTSEGQTSIDVAAVAQGEELAAAAHWYLGPGLRALEVSARDALDRQRWPAAFAMIRNGLAVAPDHPTLERLKADLRQRAGYVFDIREVDFRNFSYPSVHCARAYGRDGLRRPITVRDGEFPQGASHDVAWFGVSEVLHDDLNGDGTTDAVVVASCGWPTATWSLSELFLVAIRDGRPTVLATLGDDRLNADYRRYYGGDFGLWPRVRTCLANGVLVFNVPAEGSHAQPAYEATLRYRWDGWNLVLAGRPDRAPFDSSPPADAPSGPSGSADAKIPPQVRSILDAHHPGWALAAASKEDIDICMEKTSPFHPSVIWGDFDGDARDDYALQLTLCGTAAVMAFFARGAEFEEVPVTDTKEPGLLVVARKGTRYFDHERGQGGEYGLDTISLRYCEKSEVAFIFEAGKFKRARQ